MIEISITLPSVYPEACARALKNIRNTTVGDYEVVVVSPFDPGEDRHVRWVKDGPERRGAAVAQAKAAAAAQGEFIAAFSDDFLFAERWDRKILNDFLSREDLPVNRLGPYAMGMRYGSPNVVGTHFGVYYPNFPFMRRQVVEKIGWISPDYRHGFGDGDLGLRIWARGGRCEWSDGVALTMTPDDQRKGGILFSPEDFDLFTRRWNGAFGKSWKQSNISDFCYDIIPEDNQPLIDTEGRTFFHPHPSFAEKVRMPPQPPKLIETLGMFNIVLLDGIYLGVPHALGPIDLAAATLSDLPGLIRTGSLRQTRRAIQATRGLGERTLIGRVASRLLRG